MKSLLNFEKSLKQILPGLALSFLVAIMSKCLAIFLPAIGGATIAIFLGIFLGNVFFKQSVWEAGTKFSESRLLELSVVLLGLTVTFKTIGEIGLTGLFYIIMMMLLIIIITIWIGQRLGFSKSFSLLIAGGNAVCGSSAIGAIAPAIQADDESKGQAITLVNLQGTVLMLLMPVIGYLLYGNNILSKSALIGGTLQSVGQVVASASLINPQLVDYAMLFKITRILFLVAVVISFQRVTEVNKAEKSRSSKIKLPLPWYIICFLVLCIINSNFKLDNCLNITAHQLSSWFEITALAAIGLRLNFAKFIKAGLRFLFLGILICLIQIILAAVLIYLWQIH
ncbi:MULTISPECIES: putative sulfate exporter family transporter [unclassified Enterococcus]|uniref:YeiH family protein n=1 Tax=unclassified Enterococcus TaxID=2608891 RepID=UPI0015578CDC|nr:MULTISPECIES: putative sulfate exporter family transporter [unclassified Enterococcus]MBS7576427.1 putative sulfate exporter family transporter [Enterococcus sp. MMGLQ5-2]MBS7583659.1 putative sulfate exporter family transporter [Enterococcus sp. MMGLQ5-1]NPD11520.1 putative sulfate exporter family transporter [Enterococcus sp. MMGLQ5-1]NPD36264.1 putative sulfate exporter family transporter [Enterococcus sp. MMGLQ5-2]